MSTLRGAPGRFFPAAWFCAAAGLCGLLVPLRGQDLSPAPDAAPPPRVERHMGMLNGDTFGFEFNAFAQGHFLGSPSWAATPIRIPARNVDFLEISTESVSPGIEPTHTFLLSDGSALAGRMLDGADRPAHIETLWGQTLHLRSDMILAMEAHPAAANVMVSYALPLSQWTSDARESTPAHLLPREIRGRGIRMSTGNGLSQEMGELPQRFVVDLRLGGGAHNQFTITLDTVKKNKDNRFAGLTVSLTNSMLFVRGKSNNASQQFGMLAGDSNHFRFYVDRTEKKFRMELNGVLQEAMALPHLELEGAVRLNLRSQTNDILLEKFRMESWDGLFSLEMPAKPLPPGKVRVRLNNGDVLDADWLSLGAKETRIQRGNSEELFLSLDRVREIRASPASLKRPRRNPRDVNVFLHASLMPITVELETLTDEFLEGRSEVAEELLRIPLDHIRRIVFNPYRRKDAGESVAPFLWPSLWDK